MIKNKEILKFLTEDNRPKKECFKICHSKDLKIELGLKDTKKTKMFYRNFQLFNPLIKS